MRKKRAIKFAWLKGRFKRFPATASIVGGVALCTALVLGLIGLTGPTQSAPVPEQTITLYTSPSDGLPLTTVGPNMLDWVTYDHPSLGLDDAYTDVANRRAWNGNAAYTTERDKLAYAFPTGTSGFWNGFVTPKHVVMDGDAVRFMGYYAGTTGSTTNPQMDRFFTSAYTNAFDAMTFTIRPSNLNYHTFNESGFLFNGSFSGSGATTTYTGYMLLLKNSQANTGTVSLSLVYCNGSAMNTDNYAATPGNRTTIATYKTGILNTDTTPFDVRLEREPTGAFRLYLDGDLKTEISATTTPALQSTASGFGFFIGYYSGHACTILTVIQYDDVTFTGQFDPEPARTRVQFREYGTNAIIGDDQDEEYWANVRYQVDPPPAIDPLNSGTPYVFLFSDPPDLDPLLLTPYKTTGERLITLYYERQSAFVEKHASVNGAAKDGSPVDPAHVDSGAVLAPGNTIDYSIDINNTGPAESLGSGSALPSIAYAYDDPLVNPSLSNTGAFGIASTNITGTPSTPANTSAYQGRFVVSHSGSNNGTRTGIFCNVVSAELPNVPAGTYKVVADFGVGFQQNASRVGKIAVHAASSGTAVPMPTPSATTGNVNTWGTQMIDSCPFTYTTLNTNQTLDYASQDAGTLYLGANGTAYVSLAMFVDVTSAMVSGNNVTSDLYLRGITLVPMDETFGYEELTAGSGLSNAGSWWNASTSITPVSSVVPNPTAYQSRYTLTHGGTNNGTRSGVFSNVIMAELPNVPAGTYKVIADYSVGLQQNTASRVNRVSMHAMASDTATTMPALPALGGTSTWGTQVTDACPLTFNQTTPQALNYPGQAVGTLTLGASGTAYVSLAMFVHVNQALTGTNNVVSDIYLRSITLVPTGGYYTSGGLSISRNAAHWGGAGLAALTTPSFTALAPYHSRYQLPRPSGTPSPASGGFAHIIEAELPNVPAGKYKIIADFSIEMQQGVANRLNKTTVRTMVGDTTNIAPFPADTSTSSAWGEQILACTVPTNTTMRTENYPGQYVGTVNLSASGTVYLSIGAFNDVVNMANAANNIITSGIQLRSIELVPLDKFEVTDILPEGLKFVSGSAAYKDGSGASLNPATDLGMLAGSPAVATAGGIDTVTWEFSKLPAGVTSIHFQAQAVNPASPSTQNMYINGASFVDARTGKIEKTNKTYHTNRVVITEMFHSFDDPGALLKSTVHTIYNISTSTTYYPGWTNYSNIIKEHAPGTGEFRTWRYYGYSLDGDPTIHPGEPREEIWYTAGTTTNGIPSNGWNPINASHTIHFYFVEDVRITIRYVDQENPVLDANGDGIKPSVSMLLPARRNWDLSVSHMRPFDDWVYQGHTVDGAPYASGLYRLGFTFDDIEMVTDHEFVLYFLTEYDYLPPVKNAFIDNNLSVPVNGEEGDPALLPNSSNLTYRIDVYNSHYPYPPEAQLEFDVVFVLDWSTSMGGTIGGMAARDYGADLIRDMSNNLFGLHPGSRVSVVCANTGPSANNGTSNNPAFTNLQLDTRFVPSTDVPGFINDIENPLLSMAAPFYQFADNAQFLRAAVDKLAGDDSVDYGSNNASLPNHTVKVRNTFTNIPVIVLVSDFQKDEPYWSAAMKAQADHFTDLYPYGVLLSIRLDHTGNSAYSDPAHDGLMEQYLAPAGRKNWAFTHFDSTTLYADACQDAIDRLEGTPSVQGILPTPGPLIVTDTVPEGLILNEPSISHGGTYDPLTRKITWQIPKNEPKGMIRLRFDTTVAPSDDVFENTAHVLWPTGEAEYTNTTYHAYYPAEKNAYVNGSKRPRNGNEHAPFVVREDDEITYTIDLYNSKPPGSDLKYDFIFALDWSGSMNANMTSGKTGGNMSARLYSKELILDISADLFDLYPDSRISVMGMNCSRNCYDSSADLFLQVDTPFVGESAYSTTIANAYTYDPAFAQDDNSQFLAAAIDKMAGIDTVPYGGSVGISAVSPLDPTRLPQNGPYYVDARGAGDMDRIPVIVLISDFQMTETASGTNNSGRNYWTDCLKDQSDRYFQLFPDGVLMTVRMEHGSNGTYSTSYYDGLMETNVAPAGHDLWSFTPVPTSTPYLDALKEIEDKILESAPPSSPVIVTDIVPEGLEIEELSISHGGTYDPVTRTVTWDLTDEPAGAVTLTFNVTVTEAGLYENFAQIEYGNGSQEDTNTTYHLWFPAEKNAYINDSVTAQNGLLGDPVKVELNDKITYTIDVHKPKWQYGDPAYDLIFVLDWSASMNSDMDDSKLGGPTPARLYSRDLILDLAKDLFDIYPDSRISVMGLNANDVNNSDPATGAYGNCSDNPDNLFLQVDTPFVSKTDYATTIQNAYNFDPAFGMDDASQFLAAAIDKMMGIDTVNYGANNGAPWWTPQNPLRLPQNGPYNVEARDPADLDRTPIIVFLSDFQMTEAADKNNNTSGRKYWSECMKDQSDRYFTAFPGGILLTVRMDHDNNAPYKTSSYTNLMKKNVAPAGHERWGFTDVPANKPYLDALDDIEDLILDRAPPAIPYIVTDEVPDGLDIEELSISHGGTYDPATHTVTWDLTDEPPGYITLTFDVTARNPALYENTAHVVYSDAFEEDTNTTYHLLDMFKLHIRQIVVDPLSGLPLPVIGYYSLLNGTAVLPLNSDSVTPGYPFTDYILKPNAIDRIYTLTDIVPQYYEFAGHMQNDGASESGHPTASPLTTADTATLNGAVTLNYSNTGEIWITVYIKPKGTPGDHQTGVETNRFGRVYPIII